MTNQTTTNLSLTPLKLEEINEIITTLDEWLKDDSGYDELTWPELKIALNL